MSRVEATPYECRSRELPESSQYLQEDKHVEENAQQYKHWNYDYVNKAETQHEHHSLSALPSGDYFSKALRQGNIFLCYTDT